MRALPISLFCFLFFFHFFALFFLLFFFWMLPSLSFFTPPSPPPKKALYSKSNKVVAGTYLCVTPREHRGTPDMCEVNKSKMTGRLGFMFQRQRYEYFAETEAEYKALKDDDFVGEGEGAVQLIPSPIDMPVGHYVSNAGIRSEGIALKREQFGKNLLAVQPPNFITLYKEQLLSPLAMFQFFTSALCTKHYPTGTQFNSRRRRWGFHGPVERGSASIPSVSPLSGVGSKLPHVC